VTLVTTPVVAGGMNYVDTTAAATTYPTGSGATMNITTSGGAITAATLVAGGTGYPASATIDLSITGGGGTGGIVAVTTNNQGVVVGLANQIGGSGQPGSASPPLAISATLLNAATDNGNINLTSPMTPKNATGNLPLGVLNAGEAMIQLIAVGAITDGTNGGGVNLTAVNGVYLTTTGSNSAIGTSAHPIQTALGMLTAATNDGGVFVNDSSSSLIPSGNLLINSVLAIQAGGSAAFANSKNQIVYDEAVSPFTQEVGTDDVSITASGSIVLAGTVTAPNMVTMTASGGSILEGTPTAINVIGQSVDLTAAGSIGQVADPILSSNFIGLMAQSITASTTNGDIALDELMVGTVTSVIAGGVDDASNDPSNVLVISTQPSLGIGTITAPGTVTVQVNNGALMSGTGTDISGQSVALTAAQGIGTTADPFTVTASNLTASVSQPGDPIELDSTIGLTSVSATTSNGDVAINYTGGSLDFTASTGLLTASGGGDRVV
jgi:hypothetical protein